jgi:predicted Zn-dependent peptidase
VRVKNLADLPAVQQQVIATAESFGSKPVDAKKLEALKEHLRYEFALQLNNSESIASTAAQYVALRRTPETINRYYDAYAKLTPADIRKTAQKYLVEKNRTVVTLSSVAAAAGTK